MRETLWDLLGSGLVRVYLLTVSVLSMMLYMFVSSYGAIKSSV